MIIKLNIENKSLVIRCDVIFDQFLSLLRHDLAWIAVSIVAMNVALIIHTFQNLELICNNSRKEANEPF